MAQVLHVCDTRKEALVSGTTCDARHHLPPSYAATLAAKLVKKPVNAAHLTSPIDAASG